MYSTKQKFLELWLVPYLEIKVDACFRD